MAQKDRKINKRRGTRTCGYGNAKKHRGAGSRGGRGRAGSCTHKQINFLIKSGGSFLGKTGFKRHNSIQKVNRTITLAQIERLFDSWLAAGKIKEEKGAYVLNIRDLGFDKVLGTGMLTRPINVVSPSFAASAKAKIEEAGGKAIETEE